VYLLYVDESGRPKGTSTTHLVVAGLGIHEDDCFPLAKSLRNVQTRWVGASNAHLELHATDVWGGRREWSQIQVADRRRLIKAVFRHLANWQSPSGREPRYFGVVVHKPSFPVSAVERAHEEIFARFDDYISRLHRQGDSHRALAIADDSSYESILQTLARKWKSGARLGPLHSFVEVPLYVDSSASRLVQAADFVAWAIFQYYENGHPEHLQRINRRLDAHGGVQHGLVHLKRGYRSCPCIACDSRRTKKVADTLPGVPGRGYPIRSSRR
jgi:Protein of unknown function (DUF3800)